MHVVHQVNMDPFRQLGFLRIISQCGLLQGSKDFPEPQSARSCVFETVHQVSPPQIVCIVEACARIFYVYILKYYPSQDGCIE